MPGSVFAGRGDRTCQPQASALSAGPRGAPRSYLLLIRLARRCRVRIGRLGSFVFPAGRYVYVGSARRALDARIARHLGRSKTRHWHIDYLLAAPGARVLGVLRSAEPECKLANRVPGRIPVPGFGSGDCKAGCGSHLKYLGRRKGRCQIAPLRSFRSLRSLLAARSE